MGNMYFRNNLSALFPVKLLLLSSHAKSHHKKGTYLPHWLVGMQNFGNHIHFLRFILFSIEVLEFKRSPSNCHEKIFDTCRQLFKILHRSTYEIQGA